MGLVNRSLGASDLHAQALALARDIAAGPTAAFRASKAILAEDIGYDAVAELEAQHQARLIAGRDGREGIAAFLAKRKPAFTGE